METLFPVKEVPAFFEGQDSEIYENTGHKFIIREDTNEVLSCMTDKYQLVPNKEIYNITSDVIKQNGGILTSENTYGNGARTMWEWQFPKVKVEIADNDYVNPQIIIQNSYDGTSEISAIAGAFRLVCTNGMIIGHKIGNNGIRHNIWNDIDNFYDIVQAMINRTEEVFNDDFPKLINTPVKEKHIADMIEMLPMQTMTHMMSYMTAHKIENYWDLMNAATWITSHKMNRKKEATRKLEKQIYPKITGMLAEA